VPVRAQSRVSRRLLLLLERGVGRGAIALWIALISADASAQFSGSVNLVSDYRYRGVSLSHGDPAAQIAVTYDDARGGYAGAFASTVRLAERSNRGAQAIAFVGYAKQWPSGVTFDVGADYSAFTGAGGYDYPEAYAGFAFANVSGRLYYAPRYFGLEGGAVYGELNGAQRVHDRVRLLAHVGMLQISGGNPYGGWPDHRVFDARAGVAIDFDPFNVQVNWVGISAASAAYPITGTRSRNGVVLTASWMF
jgi:uncharacterized protein (TIGR02001 family)